uniref:RING-type domain-containing protein n=1 Tax=Myripristis murdjan TaxID=586833 RepID=A0A667Z3U1_9TELE
MREMEAGPSRRGHPTPENVSSSSPHEERHGDFSTEEDLTCRICYQVFSKPVMLQCGHSFCKDCVDNYWKVTVFHKCPLCKKFLPDTKPSVNFALKNLIENYKANRSLSNQSGHEENPESCQVRSHQTLK